jgi:uncharacterized protein
MLSDVSRVLRSTCTPLSVSKVLAAAVRVGFVIGVGLVTGCASSPKPVPPARSPLVNETAPSIETRARTFVAELAGGQWAHPKTAFDADMTAAAPPNKVAAIWRSLEDDMGVFRAVESAKAHDEGAYRVVHLTCRFDRGAKTLRLVFDREDKLAGLFIRPPEVAWAPPGYANVAAFDERGVQVGTSPALPGTLTLPKGSGPFPAVVLVHGSGPNDRDESNGGAKPFKDLAWGLASKGVAVLRYEKRSRVAPAGIVTQRDEVEAPARDAIALLQNTPGIDPKRVYLLGHSQGGYLAPRIAAAVPSIAGVVILAGPTRPLVDSLIDQLTYFTTLEPTNAGLRTKLEAAEVFKQRVADPGLRPDEELAFPIGGKLTGAYFLDVRGYDPASVAEKLTCRIFVLQGDRDYQVTAKDFEGWRKALVRKPLVRLTTYPSLNHLFISGTGTPGPAEYDKPGHVDAQVIGDLAAWIAGG